MLVGPAVLAFCFRTKVDGQDQQPSSGRQAQCQGWSQNIASAAGLEILEAILGHLEMLIRLANPHWSWVASVELRVQAFPSTACTCSPPQSHSKGSE